jgi:hypothetical protein
VLSGEPLFFEHESTFLDAKSIFVGKKLAAKGLYAV